MRTNRKLITTWFVVTADYVGSRRPQMKPNQRCENYIYVYHPQLYPLLSLKNFHGLQIFLLSLLVFRKILEVENDK